MSRVDQARKGYLNRDLKAIARAHEKKRIHQSIHHKEDYKSSFNLPEIILGGQDGIVNVLGVILGVAAATVSSKIVLVAGLAATFAESVSMAAVAYTSRLAEADYYQSELERERYEIEKFPQGEREEIKALYENYGFRGQVLEEIVDRLTSDKEVWLKVMMEQELKLEKINRKEALPTAAVVGFSALIGSFIPLLPFFFLPIKLAMILSLVLSSLTLFLVGFYKAKMTLGRQFIKQALEMMFIGMLSAGVGYLIGSLFKV
jgi:predicted membrane protein (TIGR00267 family)